MSKPALEPAWKRAVRTAYIAAFAVTLMIMIAHALLYEAAFQAGSLAATADKTEVLFNHGEHVFVTTGEKNNLDILFNTGWWAVLVLIAAVPILHYGLRVRLFAHFK